MLGPFLKTVLSEYDEAQYRIGVGDYGQIIEANSGFEEQGRLDIRVEGLAKDRVVATLRGAQISVPKDAVVIDLCCGTGYVARSLIESGLTSTVIGVDIAGGQLAILRKAVEDHAVLRGGILIVQANTMELPIADGAVDLIVGNSFLHHFPDVGAALKEIRRVLKPGGRFVVLHEPSDTSTFFESFPLSVFKRIVVRNYTDLWQFAPNDLERLLLAAGFESVRIRGTGVLSSILFGAPSILANKYFAHADFLHVWLQRIRGRLNASELRFSFGNAPSLLVEATNGASHEKSSAGGH